MTDLKVNGIENAKIITILRTSSPYLEYDSLRLAIGFNLALQSFGEFENCFGSRLQESAIFNYQYLHFHNLILAPQNSDDR